MTNTSSTQSRFRVLVCGGRKYEDSKVVFAALDEIRKHNANMMLIQGGALGADWLARLWADETGVMTVSVNAQWNALGSKAGPIRNSWMLELAPDLVLAFPGGSGTADMVRKAKAAGIPVREVS